MLQTEVGALLTPPSGKERASDWLGLEAKRHLRITFDDNTRCGCILSLWFWCMVLVVAFLCCQYLQASRHKFSVCPCRPACDIAISGLGWISIEQSNKLSKSLYTSQEEPNKEVQFTVHVPKPIELFVRPSMPVGKAGAEWYQYQELTEEEEEMRPRLYY